MAPRTLQTRALTDGELIAQSSIAAETFHELFDRRFKEIYRYLARRVGRDRVEDLASQTFAVALVGSHVTRS